MSPWSIITLPPVKKIIWSESGEKSAQIKPHLQTAFTRGIFCLLKMLTDGLEWCGLLVDYCDVFISCLDSHSDGTHSLQSIHCWDSDAMLHFSKSDEETNSSISWDCLRVNEFSANFHFWVNYSFRLTVHILHFLAVSFLLRIWEPK